MGMTGLEKFSAAFSPNGTQAFPAVACYTGIYERDHFSALTDLPWWHLHHPDPRVQAELAVALHAGVDFDWYVLSPGASTEEQQAITLENGADGVYRCDRRSDERTLLTPPVVSGTLSVLAEQMPVIDDLHAFLEAAIPSDTPAVEVEAGREQQPLLLRRALADKCALQHVASPLWAVSSLLGYAQWFEYMATDPEPVFEGCARLAQRVKAQIARAAAIGCRAIWIEECLTDQIGPARFARYNLPLLREVTRAIREAGLWSIYYFCGDPWPVWDLLMESGADAISLEESKKGFAIDIDEIVSRVDGRMIVFGNLDAIGMLEQADSKQLRSEIARQLEAGRRNGGRFVMSTGSPITPATPVERVREYVAVVRELSA